MFHLVSTLKYINDIIGGQRFAGMDQNPKGVRDLLGAAISDAERHDKAASELLAAVKEVRAIIAEAAKVGFNYAEGGDWTERLFKSQGVTKKAVDAAAAAGIKEKNDAL